ncbi:MAG: UTP--glucose-1-phosphate uridylyltransferase, partial [Pseudodonghicola sp.]
RYDCGSKAGFLQATVAFALARDDLRDELRQFLNEIVHLDKAAQ